MKDTGGSIVITSSVGGLKGTPNRMRVNTVNPGPIGTRMIAAIERGRNPADVEAARRAGIARVPAGRYGQAEEVAAMMLFLASDEASYCTGTVYAVDGGLPAI